MAVVDVDRLTVSDDDLTVIGFVASLHVHCVQCDETFRFIGMPAGAMADRPACSIYESEARLPIRPASSDPDFGMGIPGFAVRYREVGTREFG